MAKSSVINVLINADSRGFSRGIDKMVSEFSRLETKGQKFTYAMQKSFVPAVAGLAALGAAGAKFVAAGEQAATSNARIRQIADSMGLFGDASDAVADKLVKQAEATARLTGVDQNQIKESQALLLTFGDIAKSADEVGGAFDRATQLTVDMAAAGFGSATDNAKQLGKALNDPIKGISALARSGVTFTDQEKEKIKTLVESGKLLEAQDMILGAIETQVGGTAEATANSTDKMKVGFSQMSEQIGMALLPLVETVIPVIIGLFQFMADHTNVVIGLGIALGGVAAAIVAVNIAMKVYTAATTIAKAVTWLFNAALSANPIGLIIVAVAALIAIFVVLQKKFDIIGLAIDGLRLAFELAWDGIKWVINKIIDGINSIIGLLNKIPGVDIPEIGHLGDEAEEAAEKVKKSKDEFTIFADAVEEAREPLGRFETSTRNVKKELDIFDNEVEGIREPLGRFEKSMSKARDEGDKLETTLGRVDVAFDPLNEGIETATTRLDKFFESLDQQQASDEFVEDLEEIAKKLASVTEGSDAWQEAQIEAYEALRTFRDAREDLPDAFFEVIKLEIDTGDLDRAIELINSVVDLGGYSIPVDFTTNYSSFGVPDFKMPSTFDFVPFATGGIVTQPTIGLVGEAGAEAIIPLDRMDSVGSGTTNITVNMPVGSNGDDVVRALNSYSKRHGGLTVPTLSGVRGR
jgi:tetratricopeptide (TPR) repeat protein